jgi:hypothetical protein
MAQTMTGRAQAAQNPFQLCGFLPLEIMHLAGSHSPATLDKTRFRKDPK